MQAFARPFASSLAPRPEAREVGPWFAAALKGVRPGELVALPAPAVIEGAEFTHAAVERDLRSASGARLLRLLPGGARYILKLEDVRDERAAMAAIRSMNDRWKALSIEACGVLLEAVTYSVVPLGSEAGLIGVVPNSLTMRELAQSSAAGQRHLRVLRALEAEVVKLDRLAAATAAYLVAVYALGVRDGHDDNIMLRSDGALFRVDFGFMFGNVPEIDTPPTVLPRAVTVALSEPRWDAVISTSRQALAALTSSVDKIPAWLCLQQVREFEDLNLLDVAYGHAKTLSFSGFEEEVQQADAWSLKRAVKNRVREVVRLFTDDEVPTQLDSKLTPAPWVDLDVFHQDESYMPVVHKEAGASMPDVGRPFWLAGAPLLPCAEGPLPVDDPFSPAWCVSKTSSESSVPVTAESEWKWDVFNQVWCYQPDKSSKGLSAAVPLASPLPVGDPFAP